MNPASPAKITKAGDQKKRRKPIHETPKAPAKGTKLDLMIQQLSRPEGTTIADLMAVTGWQAHSVRGAIAGSLKKKGHVILSEKIEGERRYRIGERG